MPADGACRSDQACVVAAPRNPAWTQKASILSEFGTEQLELIHTSLKTGNPAYARKTEAVIAHLNRLFPDKVCPRLPCAWAPVPCRWCMRPFAYPSAERMC